MPTVYIQYKLHEIPSISYLVMAEDRKTLKFSQSKGNNSSITDDTIIKLHVHNPKLVIYIQYKFHGIPSIGYLLMAEDGKSEWWRNQKDGQTDRQRQTNIPPPSVGDNKVRWRH